MPLTSRRPSTPGEILLNLYMTPNELRSISVGKLAKACGISRPYLSEIIKGKHMSPNVAARLAKALDTTPEYWLNLQKAVDLYDAQEKAS